MDGSGGARYGGRARPTDTYSSRPRDYGDSGHRRETERHGDSRDFDRERDRNRGSDRGRDRESSDYGRGGRDREDEDTRYKGHRDGDFRHQDNRDRDRDRERVGSERDRYGGRDGMREREQYDRERERNWDRMLPQQTARTSATLTAAILPQRPAAKSTDIAVQKEEEPEDEEAGGDEEGGDEDAEEKEARLLEASRQRRLAIMAKHGVSSSQPPTIASGNVAPATTILAAPSLQSSGSTVGTAPQHVPLASAPHTTIPQQTTAATHAAVHAPAKVASMFDDDDEDELITKAATQVYSTRDAASAPASLVDNWDDPEGYYKINIGEVLMDRYEVLGSRGRGVFSSVLFCRDLQAVATKVAELDDDATIEAAAEGGIPVAPAPLTMGEDGQLKRTVAALATGSSDFVAVKVIRANDTMRRAGMKELELLRLLATADPDGKYHCVRLLHHFEHKSHLCLVFEPLHMNLKEVQNKFGKGVGISIAAVRSYAKQMLLSLSLLSKLRIIHADIKPHNILANERFNLIKLADFGSGFREDDPDNLPTQMLVSRFYRAPEIILGHPHTPALDIWSIGCCLFELFTGRPLFAGEDNNDMLWRMQNLKGKFPHRMIKFHLRQVEAFGFESHFDEDMRFLRQSSDPVTKEPVVKAVEIREPIDDLGAMLSATKSSGDDRKLIAQLRDLLEKITVLDPSKRITVKEALVHPFIRGK